MHDSGERPIDDSMATTRILRKRTVTFQSNQSNQSNQLNQSNQSNQSITIVNAHAPRSRISCATSAELATCSGVWPLSWTQIKTRCRGPVSDSIQSRLCQLSRDAERQRMEANKTRERERWMGEMAHVGDGLVGAMIDQYLDALKMAIARC